MFDVGGGTTDFTLIEVDANGDGFTRTAVGDHLLLGGDNLDLTLAKIVEQRVVARTGKKLDALQWHGLVHACRLAKETLLGDDPPETAPIVVQSRGAKLIGGTLRDEVTRAELAAGAVRRLLPARRRRTHRSRAAAADSRSSACPTRAIPRSRATSPRSSSATRRRASTPSCSTAAR